MEYERRMPAVPAKSGYGGPTADAAQVLRIGGYSRVCPMIPPLVERLRTDSADGPGHEVRVLAGCADSAAVRRTLAIGVFEFAKAEILQLRWRFAWANHEPIQGVPAVKLDGIPSRRLGTDRDESQDRNGVGLFPRRVESW